MRHLSSAIAIWSLLLSGSWAAQPTWPSAIDELEDVMFLGSGYKSRGFSAFVTPCSFSEHGPGRQAAAEWVQAGFHDMATTDVYYANKGSVHGGLDGSLAFELNSGENIGAGLHTSLATYATFFNSRLSISDLIALGMYAGVRACGGPAIPMRGGRIDATAAGPLGVPQPENGVGQFKNQFARMGFDTADMIAMTACGHTLGGVHANDFDDVVIPGTAPHDFQLFDNTEEFDNKIATRYIHGPDTNPLSVGICIKSKKNSDFQVFNADNNVTMKAMTDPGVFDSMCKSILQRMIETVLPGVILSDIIEPYEVKPDHLQLTVVSQGKQLKFSGDIRIRTTVRSALQINSVQLLYKDRTGATVSTPIDTAPAGTASGFDDSFEFYSFSKKIPVAISISSFTVLVTSTDGKTETYDNNAKGFPISDSVIVQTPQSCVSNGKLNVVAAIRGTTTTPVKMAVTQKVARNEGSPTPSPVPSLVSTTVTMVSGATIGPYKLYSGSSAVASNKGVKYGVTDGLFSDTFKDAADLGDTCEAFDTTPHSSSHGHASQSTAKTYRPPGAQSFTPSRLRREVRKLLSNRLFEHAISREFTRVQKLPPHSTTTAG